MENVVRILFYRCIDDSPPPPQQKNEVSRPNLLLMASVIVNTSQQTHLQNILHGNLRFRW